MKTAYLLIFIFLASFNYKSERPFEDSRIFANCNLKQWFDQLRLGENQIFKINLIDESGNSNLYNQYYLEWQGNCLVLISTHAKHMNYKIPLLVRKSKTNCGELKGEQLFDHLMCSYETELSNMFSKDELKYEYKLIDQQKEIYEVVHRLRKDGSERIFTIGFKEGTITMKTKPGIKGTIHDYGVIP